MLSDRSGGESAAFQATELPATPAMRSCLERVYRTALIRLGIATAIPLALVLVAIVASSFLFAAFALIVVVGLNTPKAVIRAQRLRRAQAEPEIVRVRGPAAVTKHRRHGSESYALYYKAWVKRSPSPSDWAEFDITEGGYDEIARAATVVLDDRSILARIFSRQDRHEIADAVTTYSRTGHLVLDVRRPGAEAIYRHPEYEGEGWER
jgi:hypothetical protein